ncbi:MAG TPA: glycosyltransferase, partial [Pyrinomonadaceae bacterium]|nr:glycosyltransferase [Pyrinomonadaceae bacterium]
ALHKAGVRVTVVNLKPHSREVRDPLVESLSGRPPADVDFHLFHGIPPQWARMASGLRNVIGMTVWETDSMPAQWRPALERCISVWLPCQYNVTVFGEALGSPVFKLPHALMPPAGPDCAARGAEALQGISPGDFVFYSIFEWQERKSPQAMLEAYMRAFADEQDVVLFIKAGPGAARAAAHDLEQARRATGSRARVELRCEAWPDESIESLHARGDCYVSLHRGEGWCYPLFEAAARGTPVVATNYSGPLEYLRPGENLLVRCEPSPVRQQYLYYHSGMRWAEPDISHAAELMRRAYTDRQSVRERAAAAAERIRNDYSQEAVGRLARGQLLSLLRQTDGQKWKRLGGEGYGAVLKPVPPIPGSWYDEGYFEDGSKSNWDRGYNWRLFSGLFRRTASYLTGILTESESYLDVGCAKGFLVQALREQGKDCLGFDHSRWAIENANECVKPYLRLAGVDDFNFERPFDVLLAFSIFESLTEAQLDSFLSRSRAWARQALVATITSFESEGEERSILSGDRDLSHIQIRPRSWWHEKFVAAGWRQDALHRVVENAFRNHPLATAMKWKVYVYAP